MIFKRFLCVPLVYIFLGFNPVLSQTVSLEQTPKGVDFRFAEQLLLTYQTAVEDVPAGVAPEFRKSGFIHPLKTLSGQVLTSIQPSDHYHHYGESYVLKYRIVVFDGKMDADRAAQFWAEFAKD